MIMKRIIFALMTAMMLCTLAQGKNRTVTENDSLGNKQRVIAYIIHSGFISGYQNRYGDNLKPPTNVYHRMTA